MNVGGLNALSKIGWIVRPFCDRPTVVGAVHRPLWEICWDIDEQIVEEGTSTYSWRVSMSMGYNISFAHGLG